MEVTPGEAPSIAGQYDPNRAYRNSLLYQKNRVGFFDRKLQVVGKHARKQKGMADNMQK